MSTMLIMITNYYDYDNDNKNNINNIRSSYDEVKALQ